jgi:hypothetical protein
MGKVKGVDTTCDECEFSKNRYEQGSSRGAK